MIFWGCLVFSREFGRPKTAKTKIYFTFGASVVLLSSSFVVAVVVSTGCRWCRWCRGFRCPAVCVPSLSPCLLSALLLCLWCVDCKYGFICDFKGVFRGFWGADVYLYGLRSLRGLWGFCTRVELGGYKVCGVFASVFSFLLLLLSLFLLSLLILLSSACPLSLWLVLGFLSLWLLFLFPFRYMRKKKGRNFLRPPLSCCWLLYLVAALYSSNSAGLSPFAS